MAGNTSRNNTASALQQQSKQENSVRLAGELFPSLAPMETDNNYLDFSQDTGVSPAQVNSHTTSLATRIAGITMSHRPNSTQERLAMDERMRSEAPRTPTPTPSVQNHWREQNGQINCFLDQGNITDLVAVFDQQFNIDELEDWEQEVMENRSQRTQTSPTPPRRATITPVQRPQTHMNQHNERSTQRQIITEPRDLLLVLVHRPQPRRGTVYQDHGLGQNQGFYPGPPPPQQQHFMSEPPRAGFQEHHQQPLPFEGDHRHKHHFKQGFQGKFREPHPPQAHQPPQHHHPYAQGAGAWRGSRRNWRNNSNPITQTMEIDDWSNPSNKEFLLQNINNDYTREAPLIIEELLGTLDNIPSTLLETSIQNFSEIMRDSMSDIVKDNIIPSMLDNILDYMGQIVRDVKGPSYKLEVESVFETKLSTAVNELQDVLYEMDTNNFGNCEAIKEDFLNIKKEMADNFSLVKNDMNDIIKKEKENSRGIDRKLNDLAAILYNMNFKLFSIIEPIEEPDKDNPPHMEPRPMIKEPITKKESHEHKIPQQCAPIRNLEPTNPITEDWEVTFPKLDHGPIDLDLRRKLWRGIPKTTEWEVFSGQMPYNHKLWIKQIDVYAKDYLMLDAMVVSRLTTCMSGSAKSWYISHRVGNENKTWAWWKNAIENKYGTESSKLKLREEFDASRFHLNNPKIHE
ncbi:hypothetical protein MJO28_014580 [Puccinia striiformis f. sp. tritici]|uniref:Uncharacterized protein n=1 Tax=Puccinia striiformis f. sp. tritici TaxID=168172 RepID=A0ACC0DUJ7_9BASI|nr:hypothetical protein MJO28_014580 [Puccinia striiformis f. sp. tritici]